MDCNWLRWAFTFDRGMSGAAAAAAAGAVRASGTASTTAQSAGSNFTGSSVGGERGSGVVRRSPAGVSAGDGYRLTWWLCPWYGAPRIWSGAPAFVRAVVPPGRLRS
ncbi:hypothetical protein GCM10023096_84350 [Nonomuraea ferruginea]